ncbi:MAG TPA: gfo/Idh/MocA family oxidoreductase [Ktedonobacter sp.]|nr:gfo/Idh/MocA family oxidoreductase [Ktedonobacter sp.]
MAKTLRFGIIGGGVIGPTHAEAIAAQPDATLVAVADIIPGKAKELTDRYGGTPYDDVQAMLDNEQLDVVTICTPSGLHGTLACQAMRSGRHVIVEKPMEITHEAIQEMLRTQQEQHVKLAVISQHRFDPATMQVKKMVDERVFGRVVLGNAVVPWWRSQAYYDSGAWRGTWELDGGGVLMNQGIHTVDLLQWLMGSVKSLYAYTDTLVHRMQTEDVAVATLRFANGALGTIVATTGAYPGLATRIEILGDKGSAVIEDDKLSHLHLARDEQEAVGPYGGGAKTQTASHPGTAQSTTASNPGAVNAQSHIVQFADMIRAIHEDGTPLVDGNAARIPVEIILGIYESARTGKEVTFS